MGGSTLLTSSLASFGSLFDLSVISSSTFGSLFSARGNLYAGSQLSAAGLAVSGSVTRFSAIDSVSLGSDIIGFARLGSAVSSNGSCVSCGSLSVHDSSRFGSTIFVLGRENISR